MFSQCMFREAGACKMDFSFCLFASLLKDSVRSEGGIRKMSCFVFQTLMLSRSVKLAIRKVSEVKRWDFWIQQTLRNSLRYISCDLREFRRVFLSGKLFWNINTNMSRTFKTCSPFSLIIFESLVLELFIALSPVQRLHCCFQRKGNALWRTWPRKCKYPRRHNASLCCLLFPGSFEVVNFSLFSSAVWYRFCSSMHPLMQFISRTWIRSVIGGWILEPCTFNVL